MVHLRVGGLAVRLDQRSLSRGQLGPDVPANPEDG
jgi:hypothetical protein